MLPVHHELSDPAGLLAGCHRVLKPGGILAIVDRKHEDPENGTPLEGRVPAEVILQQMSTAGFQRISTHAIYDRHNFLSARK